MECLLCRVLVFVIQRGLDIELKHTISREKCPFLLCRVLPRTHIPDHRCALYSTFTKVLYAGTALSACRRVQHGDGMRGFASWWSKGCL